MALSELPFEGFYRNSSLQDDSETRIFRTTNLAVDVPVAGRTASLTSASFPLNWVISNVSYSFDGYDDGDVNTPVHVIAVTARPREQTTYDPGLGDDQYKDSEDFESTIDFVRRNVSDTNKTKTYPVPRLVYTMTKFTKVRIGTGGGAELDDPVSPLLNRIGLVNLSANDPFQGAVALEWMCVGLSSRRASARLWEYTAEYKHAGRIWDEADNTVKRVTWNGIDTDLIFQTGTIGI